MAAYASSRSVVHDLQRAELTGILVLESQQSPGYKSGVVMFEPDEIRAMTVNFDECNFLGKTQFGLVYRGKFNDPNGIVKNVTVKVQDSKASVLGRMDEEVKFLTNVEHPNMVKLIGVCREQNFNAIVYNIDPLDMLQNLVLRDDYSWSQRLQAAFGLASLLEFLHQTPYLVLSHNPRHILIDKNGEPMLFEFSLMSGGILGPSPKSRSDVCCGYLDFSYYDEKRRYRTDGAYHLSSDVFAYGVILLSLLAKRLVDGVGGFNSVDVWAKEGYKQSTSVVHSSVEGDSGYNAGDAVKLSKLGVDCIQNDLDNRPDMTEVVNLFRSLDVFIQGNINRYVSNGYVWST